MATTQDEIPNAADAAPEPEQGPFFRPVDWLAFATTLVISLVAYTLTLSPTVTLEDSGELVVAADYLGVPHPPGYPIWTLLAWFFQWIFHVVTYQGQPNPAWAVGFMSACFGAGACALLALLVSRSGYDMLRGVSRLNALLGTSTERLLCWVGGVAGGLLFAFSSVQWSQSVIVEVYSLNAFFLALILVLTYRWMCRPHEDMVLYATAFLFGLGLTNHQTLLFALPALLLAIAFRDVRLTRDCMAGGLWLIACILCFKAGALGMPDGLSATELAARGARLNAAGVLLILGWVFLLADDDLPRTWIRPLDRWVLRGAAAVGFCALACYALYQAGAYGNLKLFAPGTAAAAVKSWFWTAWVTLALIGLLVAGHFRRTASRIQRVFPAALIGQAALGLALVLAWYLGTRSLGDTTAADADPIGTGGVMLGYLLLALLALGGGIAVAQRALLTQWRRFGLSFYLYLPVASDQNPPMNWGYPRTPEGFWHAFSRGQYEKIDPIDNFKDAMSRPMYFMRLLNAIITKPDDYISVVAQFTWPIADPCHLHLLPAVQGRQEIPALALDHDHPVPLPDRRLRRLPVPAARRADPLHRARPVHPGPRRLRPLDHLRAHLRPQSAARAERPRLRLAVRQLLAARAQADPGGAPPRRRRPPEPGLPAGHGTNAIFFGGTDPGRFVPTYMIYSAKVRRTST
jgi:hypothetical protein